MLAENNLTHEKQNNHTLQEINANLTQKLCTYEQNHANLTNALNLLTNEVKCRQSAFSMTKINYYQQQEKEKSEVKARIIQPPPRKSGK